jgi:phosphoglycerate dehydrogenase-like enzyme
MTDKIDTPRVVLITAPIEAEPLARLQTISADLRIEPWPARSAGAIPDDLWRVVEILYTSFATTLPSPERVPGLRWVQLYSAGPDPILDQPLFQAPVTFTTASGVHAINMAEYVFAVVLAWFHRLPRILEWQQQGRWPAEPERSTLFVPEELRGKTIGITGYGSIGRQVARLADAFGMRVLATQRGADHRDRGFRSPDLGDPEGILPDRFFTPDQLPAMLNECDIVVIALPLTPQTRGLFGDAAFGAMKPTALLVNIARGDICDEAALVRALGEKRIAGAALDVFHREPLPPDSPLWHLPNAFISPHISGLTPHYDARAAALFEENLRRYLVGEPLYNVVDKGRGY